MSRVYNSWSDVEDSLLLHYVIDGIQSGSKISDLQISFANTYMVSLASVSNRWQMLASTNELLVGAAKVTWNMWGKPDKIAKEKAEKAEVKKVERIRKQTAKLREQWRKKKAKLEAKGAKIRFNTNKASKPSDTRLYVKVDSQGLVMQVGSITG